LIYVTVYIQISLVTMTWIAIDVVDYQSETTLQRECNRTLFRKVRSSIMLKHFYGNV